MLCLICVCSSRLLPLWEGWEGLACRGFAQNLYFAFLRVAWCDFVDRLAPNPKHTIHEIYTKSHEATRTNADLRRSQWSASNRPATFGAKPRVGSVTRNTRGLDGRASSRRSFSAGVELSRRDHFRSQDYVCRVQASKTARGHRGRALMKLF